MDNNIISNLLRFFVPVVSVATGLFTIISIVLGAIQNPTGAVNLFLVKMIDNIAIFFPETPENYKIASLITEIDYKLPIVGKAIIYEIFQTISIILGILSVIKIYKLIPFKSS